MSAADPLVAAELVHTPVEVLRQMFEHRLWLRDEVVPALDAEIARRGLQADVVAGRWELLEVADPDFPGDVVRLGDEVEHPAFELPGTVVGLPGPDGPHVVVRWGVVRELIDPASLRWSNHVGPARVSLWEVAP